MKHHINIMRNLTVYLFLFLLVCIADGIQLNHIFLPENEQEKNIYVPSVGDSYKGEVGNVLHPTERRSEENSGGDAAAASNSVFWPLFGISYLLICCLPCFIIVGLPIILHPWVVVLQYPLIHAEKPEFNLPYESYLPFLRKVLFRKNVIVCLCYWLNPFVICLFAPLLAWVCPFALISLFVYCAREGISYVIYYVKVLGKSEMEHGDFAMFVMLANVKFFFPCGPEVPEVPNREYTLANPILQAAVEMLKIAVACAEGAEGAEGVEGAEGAEGAEGSVADLP